ncbi:MAG: hypothetical protein K6F86_11195 [Lachnospiraceae bacterium]|nr:hypothetical protein [Lachnospiraceae bacterium]
MLSLSGAVYFDRDIEETVPVFVYVFMLLLYVAGICGIIAHAVEFLLLYLLTGTVVFVILSLGKYKRSFLAMAGKKLKSPGIWLFFGMCIVISILTHHMRVTNWDDLHYWAIFSKDMYVINGVPTGGMNSSLYRDYFPIVQYLYFPVFKIFGRYRESYMFSVNHILLLISVLPFFRKYEDESATQYICMAVTGIVMPAIVSFQMFHCLGVDIIMTFLFGEALVFTYDKRRDLFYYIRFLSVTLFLTMSKTTGLIFAAIAIAVFTVENFRPKLRGILPAFLIAVCNLAFYISWKVFCRIRGNTSYLSNNLNSNITGGTGISLPDYTGSTIKNFLGALAVKHLNDSPFGLTALGMALVGLVVFFICLKICSDKKRRILEAAVLACGMAGYLAVMIYIYLFVFEEWEADSLSSFDRYIITFFGGILYAALFFAFTAVKNKDALKVTVTILLLMTINYPYALRTMVPSEFTKAYADAYGMVDDFDEEFKGVFIPEMNYGDAILFVDCTDDMQRTKTIPYCAVPYVSRVMSFYDRETIDASDVLEEAGGSGAKYVVFLKSDGRKGIIGNEEDLFEGGGRIKEDVLYLYDKEKDVLVKR